MFNKFNEKYEKSIVNDPDRLMNEVLKILGRNKSRDEHFYCPGRHLIEHPGGVSTLRINCEGCSMEPSFSCDACREKVLSLLIHNPVSRISFVRRLTTEEYEKDAVEILRELTDIIINIKGSSFGVFTDKCGECRKEIEILKEAIIESLQRDPISAFRGLCSPVRKKRIRTEASCKDCVERRTDTFSYLIGSLEKTAIIEKSKELSDLETEGIYRRIFVAKVRPFLSESRIVMDLPPDARPLAEGYEVSSARVGLYRVDSLNEDLYHILPPEYELRDDPEILDLLMQTHDWLLRNSAERIDPKENPESAKNRFEALCKVKLQEFSSERGLALKPGQTERLVEILLRCTRGLDVIELLLCDPNITDVYVNSPMETTPVYVKHRKFDDCRTNIYLTEERGKNFVLKFVLKSGIGITPNSPILDMDLEELRTRVSVISPPLSPDGLAFSLRSRNNMPWTLSMFIANKMISPLGAALITTMVNDQVALLIVGGRGTGKSSFLGATMSSMNPSYRVLTIEDTLEVPVTEMNRAGFRVQRMLSRPITTGEGVNISADDALRSSLRMGESSIVLGEVRGKEAKVLYESIRVGATGNTVLGTIHGRSPRDIFERVVYDLGIPPTSFKATDVVVVTSRLPIGRRVTEIAELNKQVDIEKLGSGIESSELFTTLMEYESSADELQFRRGFRPDRSQVMRMIAQRRGITPSEVWEEVKTRARMYETIVDLHQKTGSDEIIQIKAACEMNKKYLVLIDEERARSGGRYNNIDFEKVYKAWLKWVKEYVRLFDTKAS